MTDQKKIRNAFVVTPEGEIEERAFPEKWSAVVDSLENLHNVLKKNQKEQK